MGTDLRRPFDGRAAQGHQQLRRHRRLRQAQGHKGTLCPVALRQAVRYLLVPGLRERHAPSRHRHHLRRTAEQQGPHGQSRRCRLVGADPRRFPDAPAVSALHPPDDLAALLRWYVDNGLDETIGEVAVDRFAPPTPAVVPAVPLPAQRPVARTPTRTAPSPPLARPPVPLESPQLVEDARELARRCTSVAELEAAVRAFEGCALKRTAKNTVFADGVAGAPVMIVGEAPGADEDRLGKPFVGVSGQLMDRMFEAIGMSRSRDLYITNILFWRPPGNRTPTLAEQAICMAFTRRHIELAQPKVLVLAGGTAAKAVLDTTEGIMRLRGKWTRLRLDDGHELPTLPTFHPAYLLRTPASKRQSWYDLLALDKKLRELGVPKSG